MPFWLLLSLVVASGCLVGSNSPFQYHSFGGSKMAKKIVVAKNVSETQPTDRVDTTAGASSASAASKSIALFATLYNMRTFFSEKVGVLAHMITLAAVRDNPHCWKLILGKWLDDNKLSTMMDDWKISPVQRRQLYKAATLAAKGPTAKQRGLTLLLVLTCSTSKEGHDAAGLASGREAATWAVRYPVILFIEQRNMLQLVPTIQALQKSDGKSVNVFMSCPCCQVY
jgi:hypothetical protein